MARGLAKSQTIACGEVEGRNLFPHSSPSLNGEPIVGFILANIFHTRAQGLDHAGTEETRYRIRPRALGRWLVLPEADPHPAGGWARSDVLPARPELPKKRRGMRHPLLRAGQRPC